jgi:hypothetical protein
LKTFMHLPCCVHNIFINCPPSGHAVCVD